MIKRFFKWFGEWHHQRYLVKRGWTQAEYERRTDPDYNSTGIQVRKDIYHGYPYVMIYDSPVPWNNRFGDWMVGLDVMAKWCNENCTDKWRNDILEAHKQTGIDVDGSIKEVWMSGFSMGDQILCVAFKNEKDFLHFALVWSM